MSHVRNSHFNFINVCLRLTAASEGLLPPTTSTACNGLYCCSLFPLALVLILTCLLRSTVCTVVRFLCSPTFSVDRKAQHSPLAFSDSSARPIMNHKLHVYTHEGRLFTSFNTSSPPAVIPPIPRPWNPALESDSSSDNIKDVLTTQWAYETRPWFPLIPINPVFDGAVFSCLNHSFYSLPIESTPDGRYILCGDVRRQWETLEHKLLWCQGRLATNMHFPWYGQFPRAPRDYGYLRSHVDVTLAKKVALRSRDAFLGVCWSRSYALIIWTHHVHSHWQVSQLSAHTSS
jgi:hypothetical protein